jgi:hypothetical protein
MQEIDRSMHEPPSEEAIEALADFSAAFIEQVDADGCLFDAITRWSPDRVYAYQQAFFMLNVAQNPEAFGFED